MPLTTGQLNQLLMVQELVTEQTSAHGTPKQTVKNIREIWCEIDFLSASEQIHATGQAEVKTCTIKTGYLGNEWITSKMQGRWDAGGGMVLAFTGLQPNPPEDELMITAASVS